MQHEDIHHCTAETVQDKKKKRQKIPSNQQQANQIRSVLQKNNPLDLVILIQTQIFTRRSHVLKNVFVFAQNGLQTHVPLLKGTLPTPHLKFPKLTNYSSLEVKKKK